MKSKEKIFFDRSGFTLLETVAVLTLLALLAMVATVNYRGPVNLARLENVFEQVDALDSRIRLRCRQENVPLQMRVDPDQGLFEVRRKDSAEPVPVPTVRLGHGMTFGQVRVFDSLDETVIPYSTRGVAPLWCYSIKLADGREFYRLMFGASGQSLTLDNEEQWVQWKRFFREQQGRGNEN